MQSVVTNVLQKLIDDINPDNVKCNSFQSWCEATSPRNRDGSSWIWDWPHQLYLYPYLEKILSGDITQAIINTPPRHSKTETVTVRLAAKFIEDNPDKKVILAAYNQARANKFSRKVKKIVSTRVALSKERNAANDWETTEGGGLLAVGVNVGVAGEGAHLILVDDPVKNRVEANSKTFQERTFEWFTDDLFTRLEPGGRLVITMTRWNYNDIVGRVLDSEDGKNYTVINLPAIAETDDPMGRKEGEALCPDRYPIEKLLKLKSVLRNEFTSLFQGQPTDKEGAIFNPDYWQYYDTLPDRDKWESVTLSLDTAFKEKTSNDYSAGIVLIKTKDKIFVRHVMRKKLSFPALKKEVVNLINEYHPDVVLIEDKASGQSLIQELKESTTLPVIAVKADSDKVVRANGIIATVEGGNVYLPRQAHWLQSFIDEHSRFPFGAHDDQVDAFVHGINRLKNEPVFIF